MFRLPVCPYCGRKLSYTNAARLTSSKQAQCRSCKKLSEVRYKSACVKLGIVLCIVLIAANTLILFYGKNKTLLPNFIITLGAIILFLIMIPLKITLIEIAGQRDPEPKRKKNRRRHQKTKHLPVKFDDNPLKGTSFDK